jgi:hypothetical protein
MVSEAQVCRSADEVVLAATNGLGPDVDRIIFVRLGPEGSAFHLVKPG